MEEVNALIDEQHALQCNLDKNKAKVESLSTEQLTAGYIKVLLENVDGLYYTFFTNHAKINKIIKEKTLASTDIKYCAEDWHAIFEEKYFIFKAFLYDSMSSSSISPNVFQSTFAIPQRQESTSSPSNAIQLPKISLPTFFGKYLDWVPFRDLFLSLVHNNTSYSKIQKMYYLKDSVKGEAEQLIKHISSTEANYDLAWKTLEDRYHNKRMIVDTLLRKLCAIPKCTKASHSAIREILDTTKECLASLTNLDVPTTNWDPLIIHITADKLDSETRKDWEHSLKATKEIPKLTDFYSFLETTFRTLETIGDSITAKSKPQNIFQRSSVKSFNINKAISCPCCKKTHLLFKCWVFRAYSNKERKEFVERNSICINCLTDGHIPNNCKSQHTCHLCNQKHHTLLHSAFSSQNSNNFQPTAQTAINSHHVSAPLPQTTAHVFLATVLLHIETPNGIVTARALLDQGSQGSFITERLIQQYKISCRSTFLQIYGITPTQTNCAKKLTFLQLRSRSEPNFSLTVEAFVLSSLSTHLPQSNITPLQLPLSAPFTLADPLYYKSRPIDLILGADVYGLILKESQHKTNFGMLYQDTHFGWILSGPVPYSNEVKAIATHYCSIDEQLKLFWEQEEISKKRILSPEELACEKYFVATHKRETDGRYCVSLPFKTELDGKPIPLFENTHLAAMTRLRSMERIFLQKPKFHEEYCKFMDEYLNLGHMREIGEYPVSVKSNSYFLPHHGVEKLSSTTTKLRVVFDGSTKYRNHRSLNEELVAGPALQCDLAQIILRWRKHKIALCSDIEKMFRQILVQPEHQSYQQILWRKSIADPVKIFKLLTVTYGTAPAPFLSIRTLKQLAKDEENAYPAASEVLLRDIYVDDVITGADDLTEGLYLQNQLCKLLNAGGFSLRKWASNSTELLKLIPDELKENLNSIELNRDHYIKALGLQWQPISDCFSFLVTFDTTKSPTKRNLLSDASKLFDPQGWLAPTTIIAKILFQKLWLAGIDWDDQLPDNICEDWLEYRNTLNFLETIKVKRFIGTSKIRKCDLHGFCDASQVGFAAVVYSKTIMENGEVVMQILQAKTKVAPLKTLTIPKLELCGAHLLAKLMKKVMEALHGCIENVVYWSDSTTVLAWIRAQPNKWNIYVANRVAEIQRLSSISQWRYVPTHDNPADCASKGVMPRDLPNHALWWSGPIWLMETCEHWPADIDASICTTLEQRASAKVSHISVLSYPELLCKYSSLNKTLSVTAYILRFAYNCSHKQNRRSGHLSALELQLALKRLIILSQSIDFNSEIKQLSAGLSLKNNFIAKLCPFIDGDGCLRVGGRLQFAKLPMTMKNPILLSKKNPLTLLILSEAHLVTLHGGVQLMLNYIRRKYWVSNARHLAQTVCKRCLTCYKYSAKTEEQLMGSLPPVRITPARPFLHSGVDYAGPIDIRQSSLRNAKVSKGYICIFVCMVTKAIHLEAVSSLTTDAFLAAFRRFVSRRGKCSQIYSDRGTNFVGASNALEVMHQRSSSSLPEDLRAILASEGTTWNFVPPASPHFGGLWEAGVKSTKYHFKRITQERALNFEELCTLLSQIEACLNSRPLCPLNEDIESCDALTPAHFLIGEPTVNIPEEDMLDFSTKGVNRWRMVQQLKQHFWRRWYAEYLSRLQSRPKWATVRTNAQVGDLVLMYDERTPPGKWPLARIAEVHPGEDGLVRVVTLKCNGRYFKRPIRKICFLPSVESLDVGTSTEAVSRGTAIQPGDKTITSNELADQHLSL